MIGKMVSFQINALAFGEQVRGQGVVIDTESVFGGGGIGSKYTENATVLTVIPVGNNNALGRHLESDGHVLVLDWEVTDCFPGDRAACTVCKRWLNSSRKKEWYDLLCPFETGACHCNELCP